MRGALDGLDTMSDLLFANVTLAFVLLSFFVAPLRTTLRTAIQARTGPFRAA